MGRCTGPGGKKSDMKQSFEPFEARAHAEGFRYVAGVDEVGRGPLAGPVVAAAVILPMGFGVAGLKDSKQLSPKQRERLAPIIQQSSLGWAIGVVDVEEIDRINILRASLRAMALACATLAPAPDYLMIDGNQVMTHEILAGAGIVAAPRQQTIVKGDRLCTSIAAASVIAKVARDRMMVDFDRRYPEFGFAAHKGYGSANHLAALQKYGPSPIHRRSFRPVREACEHFAAGFPSCAAEEMPR